MSVETDITEQLSIAKKTCIKNICQRIADLYKEAKNVKLETSETDITYFISQAINELKEKIEPYYDELEWLKYMGLREKVLYVDGAFYKDMVEK